MAKGTSRFVYVSAAIAAINGALFGHDTGVISGGLLCIKRDSAPSSFLQELGRREVKWSARAQPST